MDNIAVVSVNRNKYSETFIRSQLNMFPAHVHFFYGGYLPCFYNNGKAFLPLFQPGIRSNKYYASVVKIVNKSILINAIADYCIKNHVEAILAHYGPVGLNMIEVSKKAGIPLHVYFHGYDVYRSHELKAYGKNYWPLFYQGPMSLPCRATLRPALPCPR